MATGYFLPHRGIVNETRLSAMDKVMRVAGSHSEVVFFWLLTAIQILGSLYESIDRHFTLRHVPAWGGGERERGGGRRGGGEEGVKK